MTRFSRDLFLRRLLEVLKDCRLDAATWSNLRILAQCLLVDDGISRSTFANLEHLIGLDEFTVGDLANCATIFGIRTPSSLLFAGEHNVLQGNPAIVLPIPLYLYLFVGVSGSKSEGNKASGAIAEYFDLADLRLKFS